MAATGAQLLLLKDVRVSVTGLPDCDREMVRVAVQSRGGVYSADLSRACTHLLAASRTGAKYKAAVRWGLHCVRPAWLVQVCRTGELGREEDFAVPEAGISRDKVRDELGVLGEKHEVDARDAGGADGEGGRRKANTTTAAVQENETMAAAKDAGVGTRRHGAQQHQEQQERPQVQQFKEKQLQTERDEQRRREEAEDFEYLSGIQVYITGVDEGPLKQQLVRALRRGGATRRVEMALDDVTHIVLGDKSNALKPAAMNTGRGWLGASEAETLRRAVSSTPSSLAPVPFVVRPAWLLRCNAERKRIPEINDIVAPEDIAAAIGRQHASTNHTKLTNGAAGTSLEGAGEDDAGGAQRRTATLARQRSGNAFDATTTTNGIVQEHENVAERNIATAQQHGAQQQQQQSSVFANLYFGVALGGAAQQQAARRLILQGQGSVSSGITLAKEDYVVLPLSKPGLGSRRPGGAVQVTLMWLERCLEEGKLLDPAITPLFHPLPHKFPLDMMRGIRVCVSGYAGVERLFVERLAKALGCKFNDRLTRSTAFLVCCDTKSEKFVKAQEWGAACVTIDWLYAAAEEGTKPDAERFEVPGAENAIRALQLQAADASRDNAAAAATTSVRRTTTSTTATTMTTVHRQREIAPKLDSTQNTVVVMPTMVEKRRPLQFKNGGESGGGVGAGDATWVARPRRKSLSAVEDANRTNSYEDKIQQKDLLDQLNNELKAARPANAEPSLARKRCVVIVNCLISFHTCFLRKNDGVLLRLLVNVHIV